MTCSDRGRGSADVCQAMLNTAIKVKKVGQKQLYTTLHYMLIKMGIEAEFA